jgi:hypothetical protein
MQHGFRKTGSAMKIHKRYSNLLFGALLSLIMVTVVSATVVLVNQGITSQFWVQWSRGFFSAWPIAFPTVLVVAPFVRRVVAKVTAE